MTALVHFTIDQADILAESVASHEANGRKLKACMAEFIRTGLTKWTNPATTKDAEAVLVYFWQAVEREAGSDASIRTLFNRESKELLGFPVKVQDGKLVQVKERNRSTDALTDVLKAVDKATKDNADARQKVAEIIARALQEAGI